MSQTLINQSPSEPSTVDTQAVESDNEFYIDHSQFVTEDDAPVDNLFSAKLQRLLVEILYSAWAKMISPKTFLADANVGVFYSIYQPAIVPDVFLSLNVEAPKDFHQKENRSYFMWRVGKPPDLVVEIVSNKKGGELDQKLLTYAGIGVPYYIVSDPFQQVGTSLLRTYGLHEGSYVELAAIANEVPVFWLEQVGIGIKLWEGEYEGCQAIWPRWCDRAGNLIPTGSELIEQESQRTEQEKQRANQAEQQLKQLRLYLQSQNINPDQVM